MHSKTHVGLAGISGYGNMYLEYLLPLAVRKEIGLAGVVDPFPERCKHLAELEELNVPIFSDLETFLKQSPPDLMLLATPIHLHARQAIQSMKSGSHVLCEKPLAATVADARRMISESTMSNRFVALGYQWSYSKAIHALKDDIIAGVLGAPIRLKSLVFFPRNSGYFSRNSWAGRLRTHGGEPVFDGPANNAAAHYLHNMFYVLGKTRQSSAILSTTQAEFYRANDIENHDTAAIRAITSEGVEILFFASHTILNAIGPMFRFDFEHATVTYSADNTGGIVARFHNGNVKQYGDPMLDRPAKIRQSIAATSGAGQVDCPARAGMTHVMCIAASHRSCPDARTFPREMLVDIDSEGLPMITVSGLDATLVQCFDQCLLPSEIGGLDWAQPSEVVGVESGVSENENSNTEYLKRDEKSAPDRRAHHV